MAVQALAPGGYVPRHATRAAARRTQPLHARPRTSRGALYARRAAVLTVSAAVISVLSDVAGHPH